MTTNIAAIQAQPLDFRLQGNTDWIDGLPVVSQAGSAGVVHGALNTGNGALTVATVNPATSLGAHVVTVTSIQDGLTLITTQDPAGNVTARGVVGAAVYADGITFTLAAGSTPFALNDSYAISILALPIDLTGLTFALQVRASPASATVLLAASSGSIGGAAAMIAVAPTAGAIAMNVPKAVMGRLPIGEYVYDLLATDPVAGRTVVVFYGTITHAAGVTALA